MALYVNPVKTSVISGNTTPACRAAGETYSVELTSGSEYRWTVPPEATIVSDTTGLNTHSITIDFGTISGSITVTEISTLGCVGDEMTMDIILQGCDLVAGFTTDKTEICQGDSVVFTNASQGIAPGTEYFWDFGEGAVPVTATTQGPHNVTYTTSGSKTVQLVIALGLSDTLISNDYITVHEIPVVSVADDERCGLGEIIFIATPYQADIIEFSDDQGLSVNFTDDTAPYQYAASVAANTTTRIWARAVNSVTGCTGTWDSSAIGISCLLYTSPSPRD